jgi:hypothetical protein
MALSAPELIREAMDALMRADASRLERLAQLVPAISPPATDRELKTAIVEQRALGRLLWLTRRNLRLLGCDPGSQGPYGMGRG